MLIYEYVIVYVVVINKFSNKTVPVVSVIRSETNNLDQKKKTKMKIVFESQHQLFIRWKNELLRLQALLLYVHMVLSNLKILIPTIMDVSVEIVIHV